MIRILAGAVVNQSPDVFRAYCQALRWQVGKFQVDLSFILDASMDDARCEELRAIAKEFGAVVDESGPKPEAAKYSVDSATHNWTVPTFYFLAEEKQRLIDHAKANGYDAILLVDSDLLCSPDTLSSLWHTQKEVVSGVFWTKWTPDSPPLPQVWLSHPYELQGRGIEAHEFLGMLANRKLVQVNGLGACTLIRASAFDKVGYWPLIDGLPQHGMWQGEDRHFCVRAARNRVELWADAFPDIWHCYRPEDREVLTPNLWELEHRTKDAPGHRTQRPETGDLVSFTVEPLEERQLPGYTHHERGRLGAIRMLPQIEKELQEMRAGDERIINLRYPRWWGIPEYRGQNKLVRLKLLHVKPFTEHPTLSEPAVLISEHFMGAA